MLCSIANCDGRATRRGWCNMHYIRWRKHGDPLAFHPQAKKGCSVEGCPGKHRKNGYCNKHAIRFAKHGDPTAFHPNAARGCLVDGCENSHRAAGYCSLHYTRLWKTGDPLGLLPKQNPVMCGPDNPRWVGDEALYITVHARMWRNARASEFDCLHCNSRADDWAYNHASPDPNEKKSPKGYPYSTDPSYYIPLCKSCHIHFDRSCTS